ncbi:hypothetical protein FDENT_10481 [Fusarium denticulatum]|uniref:Uncharacterized protein n=1 Tax=Fusarium denticulatum TaxID=48507 RepID=A0A8H5TMN3_9HYPO|nr:hypothetical protein FDENT_10481 [Fusarium denticulatum]
MRGPLAPFSVRLHIPRVLLISEDATGVGESVRQAFDSDDLQTTQVLFSQGLHTPATIVTCTEYNPENEASLLGLAMSFQSRKILNFLKGQMDLTERRAHVARFSFPYQYPASDEAFNCILDYIHLRKSLMAPAEFGILLWIHEPRRIAAYVEACRQYFPCDWYRFDEDILRETLWRAVKDCSLAPIITSSQHIHQQLRADTDFIALKDILFYHWDTDEILENVHR